MDGYSLSRDSYRTASAGYYGAYASPPSYRYPAREVIQPYPLDRYAVEAPQYAATYPPPSYVHRGVDRPRYGAGPAPSRPPRRFNNARPKRPGPAQNLGPKKKDFKPDHKGKSAPQSDRKLQVQRGEQKAAKTKAVPAKLGKTKSLIEETKELYALFKKGPGKPDVEAPLKQEPVAAAGKKRKGGPEKKDNQKANRVEARKAKRVNIRKLAKGKKKSQKVEADGKASAEEGKAEPLTMTEEEKKEAEAALVLQRAVCKGITEFLGIVLEQEKEVKEEAPKEGEEIKPDETEETLKVEVLTPEEEKEREEKGLEFLSKVLEDNQELRKLYLDKSSHGTFECLICHSVEGKPTKKFTNLPSLCMHACKIQRTKKRPEHRAYARAVCSVLGWDPLKLPKVPAVKRARYEEPDEVKRTGFRKQEESIASKQNEEAGIVKQEVVTDIKELEKDAGEVEEEEEEEEAEDEDEDGDEEEDA